MVNLIVRLNVDGVCLHMALSHYHHCANSSEGVEHINCLSGIICRLCLRWIISIIVHAIERLDVFSLSLYLVMIVRICVLYLIIITESELWIYSYSLCLGHDILTCTVCLVMLLCSCLNNKERGCICLLNILHTTYCYQTTMKKRKIFVLLCKTPGMKPIWGIIRQNTIKHTEATNVKMGTDEIGKWRFKRCVRDQLFVINDSGWVKYLCSESGSWSGHSCEIDVHSQLLQEMFWYRLR